MLGAEAAPREAEGVRDKSVEAIRRAGLEKKRHMNPVVDGQLVPKSGPRRGPIRKRRREEPAANTPSTRARRLRRAVEYYAATEG